MEPRARRALQAALPSYDVEGELGRGAFGVVYAARHTQLGREVAIKVLPRIFAADDDVRARFVDEAKMVASLDHPHIVPVYDYVEDDEACMLIMERCVASVGDRFKDVGVATDEACAAVLSCLAALDFAHSRGVLHRDVKPENLMLDTKGVVKLADFGIARALDNDVRRTKTGMVVGTPAYMSPEQVRGDELTGASDVYSVAMMAYELLTGTLPFPVTSAVTGLLAHHLATEPIPLLSTRPELPKAIGEVVDRALTKSLEHRHSTAADLASDLSRACVRSFGSGWLRRRGFTLHWPDMVAENERPSDGRPVGTGGTITVQAANEPHDVISPASALTDRNDTLIGRGSPSEGDAPPIAPPIPPPVGWGPTPVDPPPGAPRGPAMPAAPTSPAPPAPPTRDVEVARAAGPDGGRSRLVAALGAVAVVLVVAIVALLVVRSGDEDDSADGSEVDTSAPVSASPVAVDPDDVGPSSVAPGVDPTTDVATTEPPSVSVAVTTLPLVAPVDD
ncbi:MAG: serine/threonine-protein kinase, partial [Ilumatobacter sp.]